VTCIILEKNEQIRLPIIYFPAIIGAQPIVKADINFLEANLHCLVVSTLEDPSALHAYFEPELVYKGISYCPSRTIIVVFSGCNCTGRGGGTSLQHGGPDCVGRRGFICSAAWMPCHCHHVAQGGTTSLMLTQRAI
jgi:hypothetical protein